MEPLCGRGHRLEFTLAGGDGPDYPALHPYNVLAHIRRHRDLIAPDMVDDLHRNFPDNDTQLWRDSVRDLEVFAEQRRTGCRLRWQSPKRCTSTDRSARRTYQLLQTVSRAGRLRGRRVRVFPPEKSASQRRGVDTRRSGSRRSPASCTHRIRRQSEFSVPLPATRTSLHRRSSSSSGVPAIPCGHHLRFSSTQSLPDWRSGQGRADRCDGDSLPISRTLPRSRANLGPEYRFAT